MRKLIALILTLVLILSTFIIPTTAATVRSKAGVVSVTSGKLNVRSSASTSGTVVSFGHSFLLYS